jgi:hypothetical protein
MVLVLSFFRLGGDDQLRRGCFDLFHPASTLIR